MHWNQPSLTVQGLDLATNPDDTGWRTVQIIGQIVVMAGGPGRGNQHLDVAAYQLVEVIAEHVERKLVDRQHGTPAVDANDAGGGIIEQGLIACKGRLSLLVLIVKCDLFFMKTHQGFALIRQQTQPLALSLSKPTCKRIQNAQGGHAVVPIRAQRCPGIKAHARFAKHQRIMRKTRVIQSIFNHQHLIMLDGEGAERDLPGGFAHRQTYRCFEPLPGFGHQRYG